MEQEREVFIPKNGTMCEQTNVEKCRKMGGLIREFAVLRRNTRPYWARHALSTIEGQIRGGMNRRKKNEA